MMSQGSLEGIPIPFEKAVSDLEMRIMEDIVRTIRVNGFSTAKSDGQIRRMVQLGESEESIKKWIREALEITDEELEKIFSDVVYEQYYGYKRIYDTFGIKQIPFARNIELQALLAAVKVQTRAEFRNITNSMGFALRNPGTGSIYNSPLTEFYRDTLDGAVMDIVSGSVSYDVALSRAINAMTNSGLRTIYYDTGHSNRVEVAVRRAVMTGFRQVQRKINEQVAKDLGTDYFEVSYHIGARPEHQVWQGRVYSYEQLQSICGLGSVTGLHGANCYHDYNAFIPGISVRNYTDQQLEEMMEEENTPKQYLGKEYTAYQALQKQRQMERGMRKTRQDIRLLEAGEASKDSVTVKKARYQVQMQQYKAFSKAMKLPEQMPRVYQDGLGRVSVGGRINSFTDKENGAIIKAKKMYRKKDKNLIEPMPKKQLQKIVKAFRRQGGLIQMSDSTDAYLDYKKAEAITYDAKTILMRQRPGRAAVFEELIHAAQYREGRNDGTYKSRLQCEIEAQEKLLRNQKAYQLTQPEIRQTKRALSSYQKELKELLRREGKNNV
ncbi:hypothetical protein IMSAGC020_01965 [Lachnospiraceae bacterium]|nr:hypothetical protein IMSAGC020_01965 [Lachnospiraceae bacterium]